MWVESWTYIPKLIFKLSLPLGARMLAVGKRSASLRGLQARSCSWIKCCASLRESYVVCNERDLWHEKRRIPYSFITARPHCHGLSVCREHLLVCVPFVCSDAATRCTHANTFIVPKNVSGISIHCNNYILMCLQNITNDCIKNIQCK